MIFRLSKKSLCKKSSKKHERTFFMKTITLIFKSLKKCVKTMLIFIGTIRKITQKHDNPS
jgi:hypothetical protein